MITDQPVNNHDDMCKVTDNILRDAGMTIQDSGGKVTFAVRHAEGSVTRIVSETIKAGTIKIQARLAKDGTPVHPLYLPAALCPIPYHANRKRPGTTDGSDA